MKAPSAASLWWKGFRCGLRGLLTARSRSALHYALRLLCCPVDLWRYFEFQTILTAYDGSTPVLDIGSPKLIALLLAQASKSGVVSGDVVPTIGAECTLLNRCAVNGRTLPVLFDARALPFADNTIPFISCVSVIEHIGDDGDTQAIREIARVLRAGGTLALTTPLVPHYHEQWNETDPYGGQSRNQAGKVFFSRFYDSETFLQRILQPSGLKLVREDVWQEVKEGWYIRYCRRCKNAFSPRALLMKMLDPYWVLTKIEIVPGGSTALTRHGLISAIMEKE